MFRMRTVALNTLTVPLTCPVKTSITGLYGSGEFYVTADPDFSAQDFNNPVADQVFDQLILYFFGNGSFINFQAPVPIEAGSTLFVTTTMNNLPMFAQLFMFDITQL